MYKPNPGRYERMTYRRCGASGLKLPALSLGLWHNFGSYDVYENARAMIHTAFDLGITHFDLANNYGPEPGSAEETMGRILKQDLTGHRDELILSSKAGYLMWPGPYGDWGSRKYLMASLDQSLRRMGLDYVDIFYSHRPDPATPMEETMGALSDIVRQGKALYVGISNYNPDQTRRAVEILKRNGTPCLIHQAKYSMFQRTPEEGLLDALEEENVGLIAFSPLAQGMLTDRYLNGIPEGSRASRGIFLKKEQITEEKLRQVRVLNEIARERGQSLAQMALAWLLKDSRVTSVLVGASSVEQLLGNLKALENTGFPSSQIARINEILA